MRDHSWRSPEGEDRRREERYFCNAETSCQVLDPQANCFWPAAVWNISRGGICLLLGPRFEPGRVLIIELENKDRDFFCRLDMEVKYSGICFPNGAWLHGCAFSRPLEEEELAALV
jgi:hypothetical protein